MSAFYSPTADVHICHPFEPAIVGWFWPNSSSWRGTRTTKPATWDLFSLIALPFGQ